MGAVALVFLLILILMGLAVFRLGHDADWHWAWSGFAGLIPVAFTFFLGIFGLIIGAVFLGALWKATA